MTENADSLQAALVRHAIELPDEQIALLDRYCQVLWDWNTKLNLTRHTSYEKFVARDVVDSLVIAGVLGESEKILDVGTGGGVPGVVLAIVRPDLRISLCDSVQKKARAVADIVAQLGLNLPVYPENVQQVLQAWSGDTLVLRAVARLRKILNWVEPHWVHFIACCWSRGPLGSKSEARPGTTDRREISSCVNSLPIRSRAPVRRACSCRSCASLRTNPIEPQKSNAARPTSGRPVSRRKQRPTAAILS